MPSSYRLRQGLSFCQIDGETIFLDIQSDRYFRLSDRMEAAFTAFVAGARLSEEESELLGKNNILTTTCETGRSDLSSPTVPLPTRSAIELPGPAAPFDLWVLLEVTGLVVTTRRMLKTRRLAYIIESLVRSRRERTERLASQPATASTTLVCNAARAFHRARLCVPLATSCLLDSIALAKFLSRRGIETRLVFGVTRLPFAAHCWVQFRDYVLNDTVGNVAAHTPIRTV